MLSELINFGRQFTLRETLRDQDTHNWVFPQSLADVFFFFVSILLQAVIPTWKASAGCLLLSLTWKDRETPNVSVMTHRSRRVYPPTADSAVSVTQSGARSAQLFHFEPPSKINTYYKRCMREKREVVSSSQARYSWLKRFLFLFFSTCGREKQIGSRVSRFLTEKGSNEGNVALARPPFAAVSGSASEDLIGFGWLRCLQRSASPAVNTVADGIAIRFSNMCQPSLPWGSYRAHL